MAKELLRIEDLDGKVKVICEDRQRMAAAVGVFLYKSIMDGERESILALADIICALGGFLGEREKQGLLELIKEALDFPQKRTISVVPSKIKS